jgi:hypothetical protein
MKMSRLGNGVKGSYDKRGYRFFEETEIGMVVRLKDG